MAAKTYMKDSRNPYSTGVLVGNYVEDKFGAAKTKKILKGAELALSAGICKVEDDDVGGHRFMTLTDPDGFLFSNDIISQIFFYVSE